MNKKTMRGRVARKGQEVAFAANLNFATYDLVSKAPVVFSILSTVVGILGLVYPVFQVTGISVCLLSLGVVMLYVERYPAEEYGQRAKQTLALLEKLESLYYRVDAKAVPAKVPAEEKDLTDLDFSYEEAELAVIEQRFLDSSCTKQILMATWYATYKLYAEKRYAWIEEELKPRFWKDKMPATAKILLIALAVAAVVMVVVNWRWIVNIFQ